MITLKKPEHFKRMEVAGRCVAAVHRAVRRAAAPGVTTDELDAVAARVIADHDCRPSFLNYHGFPKHICASPNEVIVHGIPSGYELQDGDIISIDAGAIFERYHADAAITFGVGEISDEAARLIETTERAMWAGIAAVQVGARIGDVGAAIQAVGDEGGYGIVREYVGHGIGLNMHEKPNVPNYGTPGTGMRLREGMAICIEPMFNAGGDETELLDDGWTVVTADGTLSAHWEHTVAITDEGIKVLTAQEEVGADLWEEQPKG